MKELQQAKVLATAVKISKNEIEKRVSTLQEQLDSIKVIRGPVVLQDLKETQVMMQNLLL